MTRFSTIARFINGLSFYRLHPSLRHQLAAGNAGMNPVVSPVRSRRMPACFVEYALEGYKYGTGFFGNGFGCGTILVKSGEPFFSYNPASNSIWFADDQLHVWETLQRYPGRFRLPSGRTADMGYGVRDRCGTCDTADGR